MTMFTDHTILIDMDENWLRWGVRLNEILLRLDPSYPIVDDEARTGYDDLAGPGADREVLRAAMNHPDLYDDLEPFEHSTEAILEMEDEGLNVLICSTPTWSNPGCVPGKLATVRKRLGRRWNDRVILTHDKTVIKGSVLMDDKPDIAGSAVPEWTQVVHDRPHNRAMDAAHRMTDWSAWRESVYPLLDVAKV